MEVYFDGVWKENKDVMVRLCDPAGQASLAFDPFANPESKSNCYYIDFEATLGQTNKTDILEKTPQAEQKSNQVLFLLNTQVTRSLDL